MTKLSGKCNICGSHVLFQDVDQIRPRESFRCPVCDSSSRNRLLIYTLGLLLGRCSMPLVSSRPDKSVKIFEASGLAKYCEYLSDAFDYINTKYDPEVLKKPDFDRNEYADLQSLHFNDDAFHLVITADVFEHVRLYENALREVYRVLKREGLFLLQIPYYHSREKTVVRVEAAGDEDIHVLPPIYHGGRTLVYRDYGRDLLQVMRDIGFSVIYFETELPMYCIPRQDIIIGVKAPYANLSSLFADSSASPFPGNETLIRRYRGLGLSFFNSLFGSKAGKRST